MGMLTGQGQPVMKQVTSASALLLKYPSSYDRLCDATAEPGASAAAGRHVYGEAALTTAAGAPHTDAAASSESPAGRGP